MFRLIERFGVIAAKTEGEDTSGRAKLELLSPEEVVKRAAKMADLAVNEIEIRGWKDHLPHPDQLYGDDDELDEDN